MQQLDILESCKDGEWSYAIVSGRPGMLESDPQTCRQIVVGKMVVAAVSCDSGNDYGMTEDSVSDT